MWKCIVLWTVAAVSLTGTIACRAAEGATMSLRELEAKAVRLQNIVERKTVQAHGMIPMLTRKDFKMPTAEDYKGAYKHRHLQGKTEAELGLPPMHVWRAWENTSADTAFYLAAMSYKYRCTGDPKTLAICRRTLGALKYIYDLGAKNDEPGFLCKPYGGIYTNQTSGDQVQCVTVGLWAYRDIAPPEDRATIDEIAVGIADYQIKYRYMARPGRYFAVTWDPDETWNAFDWSDALIYVPVLNMAWRATGDTKYVSEIKRLYDKCGLEKKWAAPGKSFGGYTAFRMLYLPSLMMEIDPVNQELWRSMMFNVYTICRTGVQPDGTYYTSWYYDGDTGKSTPTNAGWGGQATRTGRDAIFARACVSAQRWFPKEDLVGTARTIVDGLDVDTFRFVMPLPGETLSSEWRIEGELVDHDALTSWLWTYWEGKWRGYW